MKTIKKLLILTVVLVVALGPALAMAADETTDTTEEVTSPGMHLWHNVWKFLNFFILAFVIYKYGRKPLMGFINKHSSEIGDTLERDKERLAAAQAEFEETEARLGKLEQLIEEVREYIRLDAERAKREILEDAESSSALILSDAKERAQIMVQQAQENLKTELVDMVFEEAEKLIKQNIKTEDHDRLIDDYMGHLAAVQGS